MTNRRFRGTDSWLPAAWKALINEIDAYFDEERDVFKKVMQAWELIRFSIWM
ncbi:MAG: hypothetical protein AAFU57_09675 [Bacteroidota bacterium]